MSSVKVKVAFCTTVTWRGEVEMSQEQFESHCRELDTRGKGRLRAYVEDLFDELGFDRSDGDFDDLELDDFYCKDAD